jgi:subfamily B ATP-binding cassette protein MsbA
VGFGGYEVVNGEMTAGALVAFLTYAVNLANPVKRLARVYGNLQRAMAAVDRVFAVIDLPEPIRDKEDAKELPKIEGHVKVDHVTFGYKEGVNALEDVSLEVKPGQMIAFVGPSGAGKSTIANLIPRFYEINSGAISIDGQDIREVTVASLREQIGIVPQETMLFSTTVMENIRYGRLDATDEEVIEAAKAANADVFIRELPQGYDTPIGERGLNLSGGQRQRMSIARAILKNPRILILDEATSALDTESEKIVQSALDSLMVGRTSFVIAHRLSTIFNADQIYVIDGGRIKEHGTHEELLAKNGLYSHLYNIQFNKNAVPEGA